MNDDTTLSVVRDCLSQARDCLSGEHMDTPASAIIAGARRRRVRRGLSVAAAGCATAGLAVILAVTLALPSGNQARAVHVHLAAAWSVDTNSNGTVTITVRQLTHAAQLERALAQAGVPAVVTPGEMCLNTQNQDALLRTRALRSGHRGVVVTPSAIPAGTKLLFSLIYSQGKVVGFGWGLVHNGAPLHCVSASNDHLYYSSSAPAPQP
jgi:hypothetical protein